MFKGSRPCNKIYTTLLLGFNVYVLPEAEAAEDQKRSTSSLKVKILHQLLKYKMSRKTARLDEASSSSSYAKKMESKMSNSVFKLYEPNPPQSANLDIFFFHGLQLEGASHDAAYLSTWTSEDGQKVWPQCWLPREYPRARIMSISYDACIEKSDTGGRMDLFMIGESLMWEITHARKGGGHVRPLILVGHSFGGLVIKQLCLHSQKKGGKREGGREMIQFLDSIRGILFYSTPHHGMNNMERRLENEDPPLNWCVL